MSDENETLTESLEDDEWALVIGADGELKGVFIPEGAEDKQVPTAIVEIMEYYFEVDFYNGDDPEEPEDEAGAEEPEDNNTPRTLH